MNFYLHLIAINMFEIGMGLPFRVNWPVVFKENGSFDYF